MGTRDEISDMFGILCFDIVHANISPFLCDAYAFEAYLDKDTATSWVVACRPTRSTFLSLYSSGW